MFFQLSKIINGKNRPNTREDYLDYYRNARLSLEEWVRYVDCDPFLIKFIETQFYKDRVQEIGPVDPYKQAFWMLQGKEAISFGYDEYNGLSAHMIIHNSITLKKVIQVAKDLNCSVLKKGKLVAGRYINQMLDKESGPTNEWGDPPFSRNVKEEPKEACE